ncbi:hypothetical protein [Fulvivirga sediminis]|uniref:Type VI secretion system baseplate subunit TssG n=1 Tax=Fulvivirga sediminis TaxID=2803949 RepID=A0A937K1K1_9BACT|nr:hypothetical protein [Fulvivirga sediminis]MBL3656757.1 hypothetical protein [Fulvivirga sediminis]
MEKDKIKKVYKELLLFYQHLRAEVLVSEALKNSELDYSDIDIFNKGTFSRSYRTDIIDVNFFSLLEAPPKIQLNLARNSLYDLLPEGFFHEKIKDNDGNDYKKIRRKYKEEEKSARSFFAPIENELFVQKVKIEQKERQLVDDFNNLNDDFLIRFWGLNPDIPVKYNLRLLKLLPLAYKIAGKEALTALALEKVINEKVTITKNFRKYDFNNGKTQNNKQDYKLGVDFILGDEEDEVLYPYYDVEIGPVHNDNIHHFLEGGILSKVTNIFFDFFIPLEVETTLNILNYKHEAEFLLDDDHTPMLGLNTRL